MRPIRLGNAPRNAHAAFRFGILVILSPDDAATWLDPANANLELLRTFIRPAEPSGTMAFPVSRAVNSSRNEFPDLIVPV